LAVVVLVDRLCRALGPPRRAPPRTPRHPPAPICTGKNLHSPPSKPPPRTNQALAHATVCQRLRRRAASDEVRRRSFVPQRGAGVTVAGMGSRGVAAREAWKNRAGRSLREARLPRAAR